MYTALQSGVGHENHRFARHYGKSVMASSAGIRTRAVYLLHNILYSETGVGATSSHTSEGSLGAHRKLRAVHRVTVSRGVNNHPGQRRRKKVLISAIITPVAPAHWRILPSRCAHASAHWGHLQNIPCTIKQRIALYTDPCSCITQDMHRVVARVAATTPCGGGYEKNFQYGQVTPNNCGLFTTACWEGSAYRLEPVQPTY